MNRPRKRVPTREEIKQAVAEGKQYGLTGVGEWNPYRDGDVGLLGDLWKRGYREGRGDRREAAGLDRDLTLDYSREGDEDDWL